MKVKRIVATIIAVLMLISILPVSAFAGRTPSDWAKTEMENANTSGLLTANSAKDFARSLSRDEFCELVVLMAEQALESELPLPVVNPFTDCFSEYVQKAYQFGIVNGRTTTTFDPNASVSRQEIAAMMYRAISALQTKLNKTLLAAPIATLTFNDKSKINDYAIVPVQYAVSNGIFKGDDLNNFNPLNAIKSEECVAVIIRSHNTIQTKINAGYTSSQLLEKAAKYLKIGYAYGDSQSAVSQDVTLPTSGAGGTVITWTSSNPTVITSAGKILSKNGASSVLTATLYLAGLTRSVSFTLTTTSLTGDQLLVQNAKSQLEIGFFNATDTLESVTDRVFLPTTIMGINVSWYSDRPATVNQYGAVTVPSDNSVITVNMTASFSSGSYTGTKVFTLKVRNGAYATNSVSLHNVTIGMSLTEVTQTLNSNYKSSITLASNEAWYFFHSADTYYNFIAVALRANKVVGVYTMVNGWETYLRDPNTTKTITVAQANSANNIKVETFTDTLNSNKSYAAFMYDTTSAVGSERSLNVSGTESFMTILINAYRYLYGSGTGKSALTYDSILSNSARSHSSDMDSYNYFSATGRTGNSSYATRATAAGFTGSLLGGVISYNSVNPFDFLNSIISNTTDRSYILSASAGQIGVGYSGSYTGAYTTLLTLVFASSTKITSVTPNVTAVTVARNATSDVIFTFSPTGFSENFTYESSNTSVFTVTLQSTTSTTRTFRIHGIYEGSAYLMLKGSDGRTLYSLPVTVGASYASAVTIGNTNKNYIAEKGSTLQLSAVATKQTSSATAPAVTWVSDTSGITVSSSGLVTIPIGFTGTSFTITAWAPSDSSRTTRTTTNAIDTVTVKIVALSVANQSFDMSTSTNANLVASISPVLTGPNASGSLSWTVVNNNYATLSAVGALSLKSAGSFSATVTGTYPGYNGSISKSITVNITGNTAYATSISINASKTTLEIGEKVTFAAVTIPTTVTNNQRTWYSSGGAVVIDSTTGEITAIAEGTAQIWVTVPNSTGFIMSSQVTVTVTKKVATITASVSTWTLSAGSSVALSNFISANPANLTITWTVSGGGSIIKIDEIDGTTVVAVGEGEAVLTGVALAQGNYAQSNTITIIITVTP